MRILVIGFGILLVTVMVLPVMAQPLLQTAHGGGTFIHGEKKSTIAFTSQQIDDLNTATGTFVFQLRWVAPNWPKHVSINGDILYLDVDGNVAYMAGIITRSTMPEGFAGREGDGFFLSIEDGPVDKITYGYASPQTAIDVAKQHEYPPTIVLTNGNFVIN